MMARHGRSGSLVVLLEGFEPVLGAPPGRVRRVYRNNPQPCRPGHRGQPVPELRGRQAGHGGAELLPAPGPAHGLAAGGPGVGEVEVLDGQRDTPASLCGMNQSGDGVPDPGVPGRPRQAGHHQRDRQRCPDRVPGRVNNLRGKMTLVQVDAQDRAGRGQLHDRGNVRGFGRGPRRVQVPAAPARVERDPVRDAAVGSDPVGPHLLPVVEHDRDCEAQAGAEFPDERPGDLDAEMPGVVDADGFVPEPLPGLAVSAQEHPPVGPQRLPRLDAQVCLRQVVPGLPEPSAARDHTRPARHASVVSTTPRRDVSWARRRVLPCRSPALRYPAILPARPPAGAATRCASLPVAAASMARSAASARTARSYWSWVARVIEPAHRDDDCAVRYFLRTLRDCARPWASSFPWRSRVLIVPPDGGETTNDSASTRSMGYTVSPGTDNARNNNNTRAQTRAWPTKALYCSLKCTRLA